MKSLLLSIVFLFPGFAFAQTLTGSVDVGAVGAAGSSSLANGVYTVRGSGEDIWATQDEFHFVYVSLNGDGEITARVDSLAMAESWTKAGVMIRETLNPSSRFATTLVTASNGADFESRKTVAEWADSAQADYSTRAPYWVRVRRAGNVFTGYISPDGTTWTQRGSSTTIQMATSAFVGLAVTSHADGTLVTAAFSNVRVTGGVQSAPPATPPPATPPPATPPPATPPPATPPPATPPPASTTLTSAADIGSVAAAGSSSSTNGVYTLRGSGVDIWDSRDEFRYVYTSLSGDGQITARIDSFVTADSWSKAAVMIRETLDTSSRFAMTMLSGSNGSGLQYRQVAAGSADWTAGEAAARPPYWVRLSRAGSQFTSYTSTNGTTWVQRGSVAIQMGASTYVGLAVTSHNDGALATATFSNVSVGGVQSTPPATPPPSTTGSAALSWVPPSKNSNGTTLTDLIGFKVYWGTAPGVYSNQLVINNPTTKTWTVGSLAAGNWYFAVTALTASGMESAKSNEATKLIQ